jgi:hypothetical protein
MRYLRVAVGFPLRAARPYSGALEIECFRERKQEQDWFHSTLRYGDGTRHNN